ncbi:hypothetical protein DC522_29640 [Microvirga sp. KLBC 81]|nr:hypothetical protein DC522_29640 [Microvirga sp. KLBC 81]
MPTAPRPCQGCADRSPVLLQTGGKGFDSPDARSASFSNPCCQSRDGGLRTVSHLTFTTTVTNQRVEPLRQIGQERSLAILPFGPGRQPQSHQEVLEGAQEAMQAAWAKEARRPVRHGSG